MTQKRSTRGPLRSLTPLATIGLLIASCAAQGSATPTPAATAAVRPSSPAEVTITQPANGAKLTGTSVHVVLTLTGATIVPATTTAIQPDTGHIHLFVNKALVSMNYGLEQDVAVTPGTYVLKAEFVAADHAPFNPRVWSAEVFFTVR